MNNKKLKEIGLNVTLPRLQILEVLKKHSRQQFLSAEDVYKILLDLEYETSLSTVYRVLAQFEKKGIVRRLNFDNNVSVFELDTGDNHDHLVCVKSGKITGFSDPIIEERIQKIAKDKGFKITKQSLVIYGTFKDK